MIYPVKKVHITQKWGVNEETYKRFGFKGHNGTDFRLFDSAGVRSSNALVYAPHDGVVKERRFDADGYGNYLKIESGIEGSILAHLKEFKVELGATVKEGDLIGIADNTGWSTGSHLHWGYYKHPRNKQNGYGGTIDPLPLISKKENMPETNGLMQIEKKDFEKLVKNSNTLDYLCDKLSFPRNSGGQTIIKRMSEINDNLATEKVAKHDQYNREKIAEVLGVGAGETFEDLVLMVKDLKNQSNQDKEPTCTDEEQVLVTDKNKSIVEGLKDPLRYIVSFGVGVFLTFTYTRFPILGELQPDQQGLAIFLIGLIIKGLDKYQHKSGSSLKLPF